MLKCSTGYAITSYFEKTDKSQKAPASFFLEVTSVEPDSPALKDGLKSGDRIVGLDGFRVRTGSEYQVLRNFDNVPYSLPLTIIRDGVIQELKISNTYSCRKGGFDYRGVGPTIFTALKRWKLSYEEIAGSPAPLSAPETILDGAFDTDYELSGIHGQPHVALVNFPAKAREAMLTLAEAGNTPELRNWLKNLFKVYIHLVYQRHDEAARIIKDEKMLETKTGTFLDDLCAFYARFAEIRIAPGQDIPFDKYGVDIPFFAMCCPYPVMETKPGTGFASDPEFKALFAKALTGNPDFQKELSRAAFSYTKGKSKTPADGYIDCVKASILDPDNHGGWPFRSADVYQKSGSLKIIKELCERLDTNTAASTETAMALIATSIIAGDTNAMRRACIILCKDGYREMARANGIAKSTAFLHRPSDACFKVMREVEASVFPVPQLYTCLSRQKHCFAAVILWLGYYNTPGNVVSEISEYWYSAPWTVAKSLELLVAGPQKDSLSTEFQFHIDDKYISELISSTAGASGIFFDTVANMFAGQMSFPENELFFGNRPKLIDKVWSELAKRQEQDYEKLYAELQKLDPGMPEFVASIHKLHAQSGGPAGNLLIANILKKAGHEKEGQLYALKCIRFYEDMFILQNQEIVITKFLRELASTDGYSDEFKMNLSKIKKIQSVHHVLQAIMHFRAQDLNAMIESLRKSTAAEQTPLQSTACRYDGKYFDSSDQLVVYLCDQALKDDKTSEEQKRALTEVQDKVKYKKDTFQPDD